MIDIILSADIEFDINSAFAFPKTRRPLGIESIERISNGVSAGIVPMMEALKKHSLPATFFIETLQSNYFGNSPMTQVVEIIKRIQPKSDFQLHIHPCWDVFLDKNWQKNFNPGKPNDDLRRLKADELDSCFQRSIKIFEEITGGKPLAFRSGNLMTSLEVMNAQARAGISLSSSIGLAYSSPKDQILQVSNGIVNYKCISELPVFSYKIENLLLSKEKLLTIEGTPFPTIKSILSWASKNNAGPIVFLTHASEFSSNDSQEQNARYTANTKVVKRWNKLCEFLASQPKLFNVTTFEEIAKRPIKPSPRNPQAYRADLFGFLLSHLLQQ